MSVATGRVLNFKLVLLGDSAVGKSSCVERFVKNEYFEVGPSKAVLDRLIFLICIWMSSLQHSSFNQRLEQHS